MATRSLNDDEIFNILQMEEDSEEYIGGNDSDLEPDEIIQDFREHTSSYSEGTDSWDSDDDEPLSNLRTSMQHLLKVIEVPTRLYGSNNYKWSGEKPHTTRVPRRNIIFHAAGNKGPAKTVSSILDAWKLFFDDNTMESIVAYTNVEISNQRKNYKCDREHEDIDVGPGNIRPSFVRDTNSNEIRALIGLYYLAGVLNMNTVTVRELFNKDTGIPYFRATMSGSRFEFLTNCLRFDDCYTREERRKEDRLAPIRDLFDHVIEKSKELYIPTDCCTIDEQLLAFRGRCAFRMYIPSKPDKYGIKILLLCDAKTFYMINAEVYMGKNSTPRNQPVAAYYLQNLTHPIHGSNRNVTCDNWFTSVPSTSTLLRDHKLTVIGTLKKNKKEIPLLFKDKSKRDKNTAMFAYNGPLVLLSYCPPKGKKKKIVLLLSSMHVSADQSNTVALPEMVDFYNKTKGGVDSFDQLCHRYSVSRKTRRWPLCLFFGLLNAVGVNSMVLLNFSRAINKETFPNRRGFLKTLALNLITPWLEERSNWPTLHSNIRQMINIILKKPNTLEGPTPALPKQGRCKFCPYSKDRKSKTFCNKCHSPICAEHQIKMCVSCAL